MKLISTHAVLCAAAAISLLAANITFAADSEALVLSLPAPTLKGTPEQLPTGPGIEANSDKAPAALQIAKGAKNVALDKPVKTSVNPFTGEPSQLTDGKKEAFDYDTVEMKKGSQWVQVDLGEAFNIQAIAIWHDHRYIQVMHDVIVQVSNDPQFTNNVTTLFNNDTDNSSGLGVGTDREYFERHFGRVFDGKNTKARYVRGYTKGSHLSALNCWQEIEVYALPDAPKPKAAISTPTTPATPTLTELQPPAESPTAPPVVASTSVDSQQAAQTSIQTTAAQTAPAPESISSTSVQSAAQVAGTVASTDRPSWLRLGVWAGLTLLITALVIVYATRHSHAAPLAKAK